MTATVEHPTTQHLSTQSASQPSGRGAPAGPGGPAADAPGAVPLAAGRPPRRSTDVRVTRELLHGHRGTVVVIVAAALASVAATLALPLVVSSLIARIQSGQPVTSGAALLVLAGLTAAGGAALATYLLSRLGQGLVFSLRVRTIEHGLRMPLPVVRRTGSADLATRLTADSLQLKGAVDTVPIQLPMALITLLGTLVIMGLLDWVLLLITLGGFAVAVVIVVLVVAGLRRSYGAMQTDLGSLTQEFVLALESLTVIKTCRAEDRVAADLRNRAARLRTLGNRCARMEALMVPAVNFGQQIALVAVLVGGGARLATGGLDLAALVAFLLYLLQLTAPLIMAASGTAAIQAGLVARARFNEVFAAPREDDPLPAAAARSGPGIDGDSTAVAVTDPAPARPATAVEFRDVHFSYDGLRPDGRPGEPVLTALDLRVPRRGVTAIVGPSGAGKSTVLGLTAGLLRPQSGRVTVDGLDTTTVPVDRVRSRLSYVDQAFTLLAASVRENLLLGVDRPVADEELWAVLDRVGLAAELADLPAGLDTALGRGADLSGGQRQRLALARAVLSPAPILLLDEPSSQLDSRNEDRLRGIVTDLGRDRAVLVVAHRLSTVRSADTVIVMDRGVAVAQGDHRTLDRDCPLYAELVRHQLTAGDMADSAGPADDLALAATDLRTSAGGPR